MQSDLSFGLTKRSKLKGPHHSGGNPEIDIWTLCNFLAYRHSGRYDTCFPRRFWLRCCQNMLMKSLPGDSVASAGSIGSVCRRETHGNAFLIFQTQSKRWNGKKKFDLNKNFRTCPVCWPGPTTAYHPDPESLKKGRNSRDGLGEWLGVTWTIRLIKCSTSGGVSSQS